MAGPDAPGVDLGVLDLHADDAATAAAIEHLAHPCIERGAEAIVLGCTGMWRVARILGERLPVPVIEPLAAALKLAEALAGLGLRNSRRGMYQPAVIRYEEI